MDGLEPAEEVAAPVWPAFGDLMACLFGLFVLFFVWAITFQVDLTRALDAERAARKEERARLEALEHALEVPLAEGRITLEGGTIGIKGNVLFSLNSADLRAEGVRLLNELSPPLRAYLEQREGELLMVSGFTDDLTLGPSAGFKDNWELSAERALTVTRSLVAAGVPKQRIFAAGFGSEHPVADNDSREGRAKNRRVELAFLPKAPPPTP